MWKRVQKALKAAALFLAFALALNCSAFAAEADNVYAVNKETAANNQAFVADIFSPIKSVLAEDSKPANEEKIEEIDPEHLLAEQLAKQEAAAKAAAEKKAAEKAYSPTYASKVTYSSAKTASASLKSSYTSFGTCKITFYCSCAKCCGHSHGITASGKKATEGRTIAVDTSKIPLGSKVYIEGFGDFIAEDRGGAIKNNKIDIYLNSHSQCLKMGVKYANVYVKI